MRYLQVFKNEKTVKKETHETEILDNKKMNGVWFLFAYLVGEVY